MENNVIVTVQIGSVNDKNREQLEVRFPTWKEAIKWSGNFGREHSGVITFNFRKV